MDYIENKKGTFKQQPLEGILWIDEPREYIDTETNKPYTIIRGVMADESGKEFFINASVRFTKFGGKKYLRLKLKSREEVERSKDVC